MAETSIKDGFEEVEHEFPFGKFRPERQDKRFRCSVALGNSPRLELHLLSNRIFRERFVNGK